MKDTQNTRICCILCNPGQTFFSICGQGMRDQAREVGVSLSIYPAYGGADHVRALIDCLDREKADAIIFCGGQFHVPEDVAARTARIPLIACSALPLGLPIACDVSPDLRQAAMLVVTCLIERLQGQGNIVHIQGEPGIYSMPRAHGLSDALTPYPGMKIAHEAHGDWDNASGARIMHEALERSPDVQAVFAHSDEMALGALSVLQSAGRSDVLVAGVDAIPEALAAIHDGKMAATANCSPYALGRAAFTHALELAQGYTLPPIVQTDVELTTADNLFDAMLATVNVFPNVLRDLVDGHKVQQQLQDEIIAAQQSLIREMSTPIIPVSDTVLVVPLIGAIDTRRAAQITASVLEAVSQHTTRTLIIDITGVSVVDTSVIYHLLQTARAARLLGTRVLLVGIGPEVAQTIVQLGVDLSSIVTRSTLQAGLEYAARHF